MYVSSCSKVVILFFFFVGSLSHIRLYIVQFQSYSCCFGTIFVYSMPTLNCSNILLQGILHPFVYFFPPMEQWFFLLLYCMVVDVVNTPHVNIVNGNNYFVKASDISLLVITLEFFVIFSYIRLSLYVLIDSYESAYLIFKKYLIKKIRFKQ